MKRPKRQPTSAEIEEYFALAFLLGIPLLDGKREFPSQNTSPTEKEARQALARILRNGDVPPYILRVLADHIEPDGNQFFRRIEFKNRSQGHPRNGYSITRLVHNLRKKKEKNAIDKVAKQVGMTPRHVARIYSKQREEYERMEQLMEQLRKDDTSSRTDVMTSDK
jgi:hypothetical protein